MNLVSRCKTQRGLVEDEKLLSQDFLADYQTVLPPKQAPQHVAKTEQKEHSLCITTSIYILIYISTCLQVCDLPLFLVYPLYTFFLYVFF